MSAYVLDRKNFIAIARFIRQYGEPRRGIHVYRPEFAATSHYVNAIDAANLLFLGNLESVSHRYQELMEDFSPITDNDLRGYERPLPMDMFGILRSLQYQSCERDDYNDSAAYQILISVLWLAGEKAAELAGAESWA